MNRPLRGSGIGSRKAPKDVLQKLFDFWFWCAQVGVELTSGGADGCDLACENGHDAGNEANCGMELNLWAQKFIFLPWPGFNYNESPLCKVRKEALEMAEFYHPNWAALSYGAKSLMGRNCYQVLHLDLKTPVDFIVCWTPDGGYTGGTGQALRIGSKWSIPIFNIFHEGELERAYAFVREKLAA